MRQVLTNLIINAVRHTPDGGTVDVVVQQGPPISIEVRDTGEGIADEHLAHIFDRFYRADASRARATGGSGLGLAIAQELVRAHGGSIEVTSQLGTGSIFRVVLPVEEGL